MNKFVLLIAIAAVIAVTDSSFAQETAFELMSPDELATELNLPSGVQEDFAPVGRTIQDQIAKSGVDVTQYWPLVILVNKASSGPTAQTIRVWVNGVLTYNWLVSTGREKDEIAPSGKVYFSATPVGWFAPTTLSRNHVSITWQAPMPFAVFFNGGIAIHATTPSHFAALGKRDSGGCVRLHPDNAKVVFNLVEQFDKGSVPNFTRAGKIAVNFLTRNPTMTTNWNTLIMLEEQY